jgi:ubiquinone/menaquinone biosynthesis C-methylase UbiE
MALHDEEGDLVKNYDEAAEIFLSTRTEGTSRSGFQNREIERPTMFSLVPKDLSGKRLLDVGCGPGIHLQEYVSRGATCFGVDISERMLELARSRVPEASFTLADAYTLPFSDGEFDIITSSFVLDHCKDLPGAVKETRRVLKEGGLFIFSVPHTMTYMCRKEGDYIPTITRSYFDETPMLVNIAKTGRKFIDYPRTTQEHITTCLKEGFSLVDFVESRPKEEWRERYEDLPETLFKIPLMCFYAWKK